jgi:hypothetical protein
LRVPSEATPEVGFATAGAATLTHKFKVGQSVALARGQREVYEIVRLMPETVTGEPQYRLRSSATGAERVASENELRAL